MYWLKEMVTSANRRSKAGVNKSLEDIPIAVAGTAIKFWNA